MKNLFSALLLAGLIAGSSFAGVAQAKGCLKGAAVGGVAGHVAGHHAVLGAMGGCVVGHHMAAKQAKEEAAQRDEAARQHVPEQQP